MVRDLPLYPVLISGQLVALAVSAGSCSRADRRDRAPARSRPRASAGAGNAVGLLAFYRAASVGPLSIAAPLGSLGAVVPVLVGVAQGESIDALKLVGDRARDDRRGAGRAARPRRRPARARPATGGPRRAGRSSPRSASGSSSPAWSEAAERGDVLGRRALARLAAGDLRGVAWRLASPLRVGRARRAAGDGARPAAVRRNARSTPAATREGDLSVVAVLGSLFPVVTVALAFMLLGERLTRRAGRGRGGRDGGSVMLAAR